MHVLRTPDSRFENLEGYPFVANYIDVAATDTQPLSMHFLDEGPADGPPIVLLHGEPTWSYLYRTMIQPLADAGNRVLAPDLIGFGRSDKPSRMEDYTYQRHVEWVTAWFERLNLKDVTLFVQDWGSLIGLRIAAEQGDRIARLVVANGFLPTADRPTPPAFHVWRAFARYSPVLPAGRIVSVGTVRRVPARVRAGYDAPFPDKTYQAGARAFPQLVPTSPDDPAIPANRAAWKALGQWDKPFLAIFGARDPILGKADRPLINHIPGAAGQPHARIRASHFIQEDSGPELAERILSWQQALR
ncbi:haloalkane dehalogenase [Mycobacterium sp. 852002-53434_SCH5985345]|uniref:haloalkane dehalogenase n=1 Tax=unclassified Mycobacterium TaxID=2642494 RepID=UPI0007FD30ED|nr:MULTISPECIES: haloalkane dehalogenase [unclassified Mycobacterium]OBF50875.1 haloalkane dehalogenase [Mycobacterium sp. 852002-53434_SCH5985345]OBF72773.1 haloalkane dehalogenase [Mycobacterium sp. 852002-51613_SCH5001154]OBF90895.1 haloalkane dehalogenase [Mycobacterium sp. 852014-52450_SCH5900713]